MTSDIKVVGERVSEHRCMCGYTIIGYKLHIGFVPAETKCPSCGNTMLLVNTHAFYIDSLWYKACNERVEAEPTLAKKNNTLVEYPLHDTTSKQFLDACVKYAIENYNPDSKLNSKYHPAIVLIWESMRDNNKL